MAVGMAYFSYFWKKINQKNVAKHKIFIACNVSQARYVYRTFAPVSNTRCCKNVRFIVGTQKYIEKMLNKKCFFCRLVSEKEVESNPTTYNLL